MNPKNVWYLYLLGDPTTHLPETLRSKTTFQHFDGVRNERGKLTHIAEVTAADFKSVFEAIPIEMIHSLTLCEWTAESLRSRLVNHGDIVIDASPRLEGSGSANSTISVRGSIEPEPIIDAYNLYKTGHFDGGPPRTGGPKTV
ncbi:MAG: hypothetical protein Q7K38_01470 [Candidatus Wildermuthbacteria bacterium]|nr:hypothetical protein [Candidatus Wildermuthbacteria bacterium]